MDRALKKVQPASSGGGRLSGRKEGRDGVRRGRRGGEVWIPISLSGFACGGGGGGLLLLLPRRPRLIFCQMGSARERQREGKDFKKCKCLPLSPPPPTNPPPARSSLRKNTPFFGFVSSSPSAPTFSSWLFSSPSFPASSPPPFPCLPFPNPSIENGLWASLLKGADDGARRWHA